ncbi:MAG: FAD/NAD(P)-binding protein [Candidatus Heimdallarchaeota archaeon]|nr:FAD/NAD(P)-binding protein [Candidatus Heimdallarchaeota archaeon]
MINNPYYSYKAKIEELIEENTHVRTFIVSPDEEQPLDVYNPIPGQFAIWDLPGIGEAPFSYSSQLDNKASFTIHKVGTFTQKVFSLKSGDSIRLRGPYGNGFPMDKLKGKDLMFIMGGIGAAPLRGLLHAVLQNREEYGRICILHGARNIHEMLYKNEFIEYIDNPDIHCVLTVDDVSPEDNWDYNQGVVTTIFDQVDEKMNFENTYALICGPPIMYKYVIQELQKLSIADDHIIMTLERRMKCGIGKCGHCIIDEKYTCVDGPVFNYAEAKKLREMI